MNLDRWAIIIGRISHNAAVTSLSAALRTQIPVAPQGHVEHPPLAGAHGRKSVRPTAQPDVLSCRRSGEQHFAASSSLEAQRIKGDALLILMLQTEDPGCDVFQGTQSLSTTAREQSSIRTS